MFKKLLLVCAAFGCNPVFAQFNSVGTPNAVTTGMVSGGNLVLQTATGTTAATIALPSGTVDATARAQASAAAAAAVASGSVNGSNHLILNKADASTVDLGLLPSGGASIGTLGTAGVAPDAAATKTFINSLAIAAGRAFDFSTIGADGTHTTVPGGSKPILTLGLSTGGPGYPTQAYPACAANQGPKGWPSSDFGNLTNRVTWYFGTTLGPVSAPPGCEASIINSRAKLDANFLMGNISGANTDNVYYGRDTNIGAIHNYFRDYPLGDKHDTKVIQGDGLHLKAFCTGDPFAIGCSGYGDIHTGSIRSPIPINDGDLVETCMISPDNTFSWITNWLYRGRVSPPGNYSSTDGNPAEFIPGATGFPRLAQNGYKDEIDIDDNYPPADNVSAVHHFSFAFPLPVYGSIVTTFAAGSAGWVPFDPTFANPTMINYSIDKSTAEHCKTVEIHHATWTDSGRATIATHGTVTFSIDGTEIQEHQYDIGHDYETGEDGTLTGNPYVPYSWMVQYEIPGSNFYLPQMRASLTSERVSDPKNDGIITRMSVWHRNSGSHPAPTLTNIITASPITPTLTYVDTSAITGSPSFSVTANDGGIPGVSHRIYSTANSSVLTTPSNILPYLLDNSASNPKSVGVSAPGTYYVAETGYKSTAPGGGSVVETGLSAILTVTVSPITATSSSSIAGTPSTATAGTAITGLTATLAPSGAQGYASITVGSTEQTPRTVFSGTSLPSLTPTAGVTGTGTVSIYAASTGGSALATSSSFTVGAASSGGPAAISGLSITSPSTATVVGSWTAPTGSPAAVSYNIHFSYPTYPQSYSTGIDTTVSGTSFTLSGGSGVNSTYQYRVYVTPVAAGGALGPSSYQDVTVQ